MPRKAKTLKIKCFSYGFFLMSLALGSIAFPPLAFALIYKLPTVGNIIGEIQEIEAKDGDTLTSLAEAHDMGAADMAKANPHLKNKKLKNGMRVIIPSRFILPSLPREGLVLNLADMRLFYYHPEEDWVSTYPVGIGRQGWSTPLGTSKIVSKRKNPTWHPPASIRREAEQKGTILPLAVLPGPKNPLGQYALYLALPGILIHGTNQPTSIGLKSSHGCIRMYKADIEELFYLVPLDTPIQIIYETHQDL